MPQSDIGEATLETGPDETAEEADFDWPTTPGGTGRTGVTDGGVRTSSDVVEATVEAERDRIEALRSIDGDRSEAEVRAMGQKTMAEHVNVFREQEGLEQALSDIQAAREAYQEVSVSDPSQTYNSELQRTLETRNIIDLAETITMGALVREESRGAHWRKSHQERKDDQWLKHTMYSWNDGSPMVWYRPVVLEAEETEYEPKTRSY
jgi:succinate dehydrogenase / fumarate reductase flavoprotein subunit